MQRKLSPYHNIFLKGCEFLNKVYGELKILEHVLSNISSIKK
jgi:hypothetical protein